MLQRHFFATKSLMITAISLFWLPLQAYAMDSIRSNAECGARAMFLEHALVAYSNQGWESSFQTQEGAVRYVTQQTANQNLKQKESAAVIKRTVQYVYDVLRPELDSDMEASRLADRFLRSCQFNPARVIGKTYVVDLQKAFSKNTDGQMISTNKDGSRNICHKGQCIVEEASPPQNIGQSYLATRKAIVKLGWTPNPEAMLAMYFKDKKIDEQGRLFSNGQPYGNCLFDSNSCQPAQPEYVHCEQPGTCTAVWIKKRQMVWYRIENGMIRGYGITPKDYFSE